MEPEKSQLDLIESAKSTQAFQRLREKFGNPASGKDYSQGLGNMDMTVRDMIDTLVLYRASIGVHIDQDLQGVRAILKYINIPEGDEGAAMREEMKLLSSVGWGSDKKVKYSDLHYDNPLYDIPLNLDYLHGKFRPIGIELTHYPGGVMIFRKRTQVDTGKPDSQSKYEILFTNRQTSDNGKPVNKVFSQTGIPFRSNIK